jgi:hypothetical protein
VTLFAVFDPICCVQDVTLFAVFDLLYLLCSICCALFAVLYLLCYLLCDPICCVTLFAVLFAVQQTSRLAKRGVEKKQRGQIYLFSSKTCVINKSSPFISTDYITRFRQALKQANDAGIYDIHITAGLLSINEV